MFIRFFYIFILFLSSCDINRDPIPVSNLDQDNLKYKKLYLDLALSDTLKQINKIGASSLLYTGSLNDTDYVYSIFSFDTEIFQSYDLCDSDSLSFKKLYMVIDMINNYSSIDDSDINHNSNNTNENISLDTPPFFAYWISYDELKDSQGNNILDQDWQEDDLKILNGVDFSSFLHTLNQEILDTIEIVGEDDKYAIAEPNQRLFIDHHLGKYYINRTSYTTT